MALAFPAKVKYRNVSNRPERIFASDIRTGQGIDVTPELLIHYTDEQLSAIGFERSLVERILNEDARA